MRRWFLVVMVVACGEANRPTFDPNPAPADAAVDPPDPPDPPMTKAFAVVRDLKGTIGYCSDTALPAETVGTALCSATKPTTLAFDNSGRIARCRVGHVPEVDTVSFGDCPVAVGTIVELPITPTAGKTDGAYRADILYEDFDAVTKTYSTAFYVHRSLNGAAACPADPSTYPTDSRFFAEAVKKFQAPHPGVMRVLPSWIDPISREGTMPHDVPFTASSVDSAPFYKVHFNDVNLDHFRKVASVNSQFTTTEVNLGSTDDFTVPIWSLRHRVAFNGDKTLAIVRRSYVSRLADSPDVCTMPILFGAHGHRAKFDCDALVLNAAGEGFCMQYDTETNSLQQAVYSMAMVAKLMRRSTTDLPSSAGGSVWGPKVFATTTLLPDTLGPEVGGAVILRP